MSTNLKYTLLVTLVVIAGIFFFYKASDTFQEPKLAVEDKETPQEPNLQHIDDSPVEEPEAIMSERDEEHIKQLISAKTRDQESEILSMASDAVKRLFSVANSGMSYFSFHGRILDQDGEPVVGASIRTHVGGGHLGGGSGIALARTDANGYFVIENKKGGSLQFLEMSKLNYEISIKRQPSVFISALDDYQRQNMQSLGDLARHNSAGSAFIFTAWKLDSKGQNSELKSGDRRFGFKGDDRTYTINLTKPEGSMKSEGVKDGQLLVQFWNSADQQAWKMNDWRFRISAINGQLVESSSDYLNVAPESGYVSGFEFTKEEIFGADSHSSVFIKHFFFKNSELTGRISMQFYPVRRNTSKFDGIIAMDYSINLAGGSRVRGFDQFD